jgi:tetratricopeptide (TPR) repeat protein
VANPRIDELRSRLQREPGSRLFAQLAEELRKDGDLPEAIRVARSGLALHPNYPSARLTLGRALIESGNLTGARSELESVLRGAPDNILASRMLAECLDGLGDHGAALLQFRAALRLNPGDRQIEGQIRALEQKLAGPPPVRPVPPAQSVTPATTRIASPPPPQEPSARVADSGATLPRLRTQAESAVPTPPRPEARVPVAPVPPAPGPARPHVPAPPVSSLQPPAIFPVPPRAQPKVERAAPSPGDPFPPVPGDFDDVFEVAPSWQSAGGFGSPAESGPILLLEDEAPTLPGASFGRPAPLDPPGEAARSTGRQETAAFPAVVRPEAPPITLSLDKPAPQTSPPPGEGPPGGLAGAETLAGAPPFALVGEVPAPPPSGSPFGPPDSEPVPAMSDPIPEDIWDSAPALDSPFAPLGPSAFPAPVVDDAHAQVGPSTPEGAPALRSATLAELYLEQGFTDKAVEVYEQVLESDPYDERARSRLIEIKRLAVTTPAAAPAPREAVPVMQETKAQPPTPPAPSIVDDPHAPRRRALERTIARLEKMLVAVRRD